MPSHLDGGSKLIAESVIRLCYSLLRTNSQDSEVQAIYSMMQTLRNHTIGFGRNLRETESSQSFCWVLFRWLVL